MTATTMSTRCFAIVPSRGREEKRGMPRSSGIALAIIHTTSQHAELDQREQQDDQREDERERRTEPKLGLLKRCLEHEQRHRSRRIERTAGPARQHVDRVERAQHTDRRHGEYEERGRREKRQCDLREELPLARAVEA